MLLVDTSVWADFLNGFPSPEADELVRAIHSEEDIGYPAIILQEVLQGIARTAQRRKIRDDFQPFRYLPASLETHLQAAEIYCACRARGVTVRKSVDCLIAAIALEHDVELLEKDRDFRNIARVFPLRLRAGSGI